MSGTLTPVPGMGVDPCYPFGVVPWSGVQFRGTVAVIWVSVIGAEPSQLHGGLGRWWEGVRCDPDSLSPQLTVHPWSGPLALGCVDSPEPRSPGGSEELLGAQRSSLSLNTGGLLAAWAPELLLGRKTATAPVPGRGDRELAMGGASETPRDFHFPHI